MNTMDKGLCDWVELYAIGGLSEEAAAIYDRHLLDCGACRDELRELREVTALLPLAAEPVPLPAGMKQRVLDRVLESGASKPSAAEPDKGGLEASAAEPDKSGLDASAAEPFQNGATSGYRERTIPFPTKRAEDDRSGWSLPEESRTESASLGGSPRNKRTNRSTRKVWRQSAYTAALLALALAVGVLTRENVRINRELADKQSEVNRLLASADSAGHPMLAAHLEQAVTLSPAASNIVSRGLATIVVDSTGTHLIVQAEKLPELKGSEAFQVWLLKDGKPSNAGTFTTANGSGALSFTLADNRSYDTVAITLEPDAYGSKPRGQMILQAAFSGKG